MDNLPKVTPSVDTSHWAYAQGKAAGIAGNTTERGLMSFGLACAGDAATAHNTRLWLKGFDAGVVTQAEAKAEARANSLAFSDDGTRRYGQRCSV